jgi:hypothetical protein
MHYKKGAVLQSLSVTLGMPFLEGLVGHFIQFCFFRGAMKLAATVYRDY